MRSPFFLLSALLPVALSSSGPLQTHTLAYEPLTATATPIPLAILTSSPPAIDDSPSGTSQAPLLKKDLQPAYSIKSYTPPKSTAKGITPLLRIGLLSNKRLVGSTTLTSLEALSAPDAHLLKILLDNGGDIFGVSWHLHPLSEAGEVEEGKSRSNEKEKDKPSLLVVGPAREPRPVLNKPVVLNEQGKIEEPEQPKTLLQKYWWVGVALLLMTLAGGGGE
ncbi:MAG: hypothetical protein MMC23_009330 [Stictis urceolatum]|nr:hypothetical protein [Stictis urceolata]